MGIDLVEKTGGVLIPSGRRVQIHTPYYAETGRAVRFYIPVGEEEPPWMKLSAKGMVLFIRGIVSRLGYNTETVEIPTKEAKALLGLRSTRMTLKYIDELISAGLIERKRNGVYWINMQWFFHGNRMTYCRKHIPDAIEVTEL